MSTHFNFTDHPRDVRATIRQGTMFGLPTSGICGGFLQTNITILPLELARDFAEFCRLNSAPCPVLYSSNPGEVEAPPLAKDSDIRTDLPKYQVVSNGQIVSEPGDLIDKKWCDLVTFYLGCSFTFEQFLLDAGIPVQHIELNRHVPMFLTNIPCHPVGQFSCNMVVSMRPIPQNLVQKAVQITNKCEAVHGAPIHIGDPSKIGIDDIYKMDFGENAIELKAGDVPVFWACGVTGNMATQAAGPELAFNHSPGSMFICDVKVDDYLQEHPPQHGHLVPRVLFIQEKPVALATIISQTALDKIQNIFKLVETKAAVCVQVDATKSGDNDLAKAVLKLSHLKSITMVIDNLKFDEGLIGVLSLLESLLCLDKQVTVFMSNVNNDVTSAFQSCFDLGILTQDVHIVQSSSYDKVWDTHDYIASFECKISPEDNNIGSFRIYDSSSLGAETIQTEDKEALSTGSLCVRVSSSTFSELGGFTLATGLYHARKCPLHDRYIRRGIGFPQNKKFLLTDSQNENDKLLIRIGFQEDTVCTAKELMLLLLQEL